MSKRISIFIADDHQLVVDGLIGMIERQEDMEFLSYANDGIEAVEKVKSLKPDLILLDLDMPKMNGILAAEKILKECPGTKVVIVSMHAEKGISEKLIKMGVNGYLVKSADQEELLMSIRWIASGKNYFSPELTKNMISIKPTLGQFAEQAEDSAQLSLLTEREKEIITLIIEGMSSPEIAEKLFISTRTVETHRKNLMKKLGLNNTAGIVRFALRSGLAG